MRAIKRGETDQSHVCQVMNFLWWQRPVPLLRSNAAASLSTDGNAASKRTLHWHWLIGTTRSEVVANRLTNGSAAFKWKLHWYWLIGLQPRQVVVVIQRPGPGWWRPWYQGPWGKHGANMGPAGPRWAPCWPNEPCYLGYTHATAGLEGYVHVSLIMNLRWPMGDKGIYTCNCSIVGQCDIVRYD